MTRPEGGRARQALSIDATTANVIEIQQHRLAKYGELLLGARFRSRHADHRCVTYFLLSSSQYGLTAVT